MPASQSRGDDALRARGQAAGAINHQNVVTIFDSGLTPDGAGFIVMEYLEGEHLAGYLEARAPLPRAAHCRCGSKPCALWRLRMAKGIVHRDLKPENMFLSRQSSDEGGGLLLKVLDFRNCQVSQKPGPAKGTTPGMIIGTIRYMAPEQPGRAPKPIRAPMSMRWA